MLDARRETFYLLTMELLGRVNVKVDRNSSFYILDSVANTNNQVISLFEFPCATPASKNSVDNPASYNHLSDQNILEMLFKLLVDPVIDIVKGNNLIIVPARVVFCAIFGTH